MISYNNLWKKLEEKKISQYKLICHYGISTSLLDRLKKNKPITTSTLDKLCEIIGCEVSDIITYIPKEEQINNIQEESYVASEQAYTTDKKKSQ